MLQKSTKDKSNNENNKIHIYTDTNRWVRVAVKRGHWPERCHGDDGVPERFRYAGELRSRFVLLCVEHDRREDDDSHRQREQQKAELAATRLERVAEDPQTLRVTGELEDTEHAENPERDERAAEVLIISDAEPDVVREDGDHIDNTHHRSKITASVGRREQPQQVLAGEDHDAGRVQTEQFYLEEFAARPVSAGLCDAAARHGLGHVDDYRYGDEEAGHVVEHQSRRAAVRILERRPHALPQRRRLRIHFQRFLHLRVYKNSDYIAKRSRLHGTATYSGWLHFLAKSVDEPFGWDQTLIWALNFGLSPDQRLTKKWSTCSFLTQLKLSSREPISSD